MNQDSINLLKECNAGCKSAVNSLHQIKGYTKEERLIKLIDKYTKKYEDIGDKIHDVLNRQGESEKDPQTISKAFATAGTEMKLMFNSDEDNITKLLLDGCNMAVKSVSEYVNKYKEADNDSINMANDLIDLAVDFIKDLEK